MITDVKDRESEAFKLIKKYGMVECPNFPGRFRFENEGKVFGFPIGFNIMGTVAFAAQCSLDRFNTINFDYWDSSIRIKDFEKKILKLKEQYEECKLKQKENYIKNKLEEIQEDFV